MDKSTSFFFYDLETSGLKAREDRIMQFAGQRTDLNLNPLGEPVNILVRMTDDCLPSPFAINVTKITPQQTLLDGLSEPEFCRYVINEIFTPGTIAVGYNTVRFDDEFMRATFWRNFYDPYAWQWQDGRSRWDLLDVVRLTRALRPEGINWPFRDDGVPTNRLELLTKLNGLEHAHAHDALSDVYATIAVARLLRDKQPKLFNYLFKMRNKQSVKNLINLENSRPFVYASGRYPNEFNKTTVAFPLAPARNGNVLIYDLRYDLQSLNDPQDLNEISQVPTKTSQDSPRKLFPIVKELCYNKCPAVAPLGVLDVGDGWAKIGLTKEQVETNLKTLLKDSNFAEKARAEYENRPAFPPALEPEAALYDGFLNDADRAKVSVVRSAASPEDAGGKKIDPANKLADFHPTFDDERLPDLLLHFKGRNFPTSLSESEAEKYQSYRTDRLNRQAPKFLEELQKLEDDFLKEELMLYYQSLA